MAVEKFSVSMDADVLARVRRAAEREGKTLSAWLAIAADRAAELNEKREALREYVEEHGSPSEEEVRWADERLSEVGFGEPVPPDEERARLRAMALLNIGVSEERAG